MTIPSWTPRKPATRRSAARSERGAVLVAFGAGVGLIGLAAGGLVSLGVPQQFAEDCRTAIVRAVDGGHDGPVVRGAVYQGGADAAAGPAGANAPEPPRPPIPKPGCADPDVAWAEGLHAHNDYENKQPLTDALNNGAVSVEADVWPDGSDLVLKHDEDGASRGTLKSKYVDPLVKRAKANGGKIYPGRAGTFQVVIDIKGQKTEAQKLAVYNEALRQVKPLPKSVNVLFTGGRPAKAAIPADRADQVSLDIAPAAGCTLPGVVNIDSAQFDREVAKNYTVFNGQWTKGQCGDKNGDHKISAAEQTEVNRLVDQAHRSGLKVRFWDAPDDQVRSSTPGKFIPCEGAVIPGRQKCEGEARRDAWKSHMTAGVDFVNTNHLGNGQRWIRSCGRET